MGVTWRTAAKLQKVRTKMDNIETVDKTNFLRLMDFYDVESIPELIEAQEQHIKRLQDRLPPMVDSRPGYSPRGG